MSTRREQPRCAAACACRKVSACHRDRARLLECARTRQGHTTLSPPAPALARANKPRALSPLHAVCWNAIGRTRDGRTCTAPRSRPCAPAAAATAPRARGAGAAAWRPRPWKGEEALRLPRHQGASKRIRLRARATRAPVLAPTVAEPCGRAMTHPAHALADGLCRPRVAHGRRRAGAASFARGFRLPAPARCSPADSSQQVTFPCCIDVSDAAQVLSHSFLKVRAPGPRGPTGGCRRSSDSRTILRPLAHAPTQLATLDDTRPASWYLSDFVHVACAAYVSGALTTQAVCGGAAGAAFCSLSLLECSVRGLHLFPLTHACSLRPQGMTWCSCVA